MCLLGRKGATNNWWTSFIWPMDCLERTSDEVMVRLVRNRQSTMSEAALCNSLSLRLLSCFVAWHVLFLSLSVLCTPFFIFICPLLHDEVACSWLLRHEAPRGCSLTTQLADPLVQLLSLCNSPEVFYVFYFCVPFFHWYPNLLCILWCYACDV